MAIVKPAEPTESGRRRYDLASPATGDPIGQLECTTPDEVRSLVARAREAQPAWEALGPAGRAEYLKRALAVLVDSQDELVDVIDHRGPEGQGPRARAVEPVHAT